MNNKGQIGIQINFLFYLFITIVIYFLLYNPIITPIVNIAVAGVTSTPLKLLIKIIPFGVIFGFILFLTERFRSR